MSDTAISFTYESMDAGRHTHIRHTVENRPNH